MSKALLPGFPVEHKRNTSRYSKAASEETWEAERWYDILTLCRISLRYRNGYVTDLKGDHIEYMVATIEYVMES